MMNAKCDLCGVDEATGPDQLLCQSCRESIGRLMSIDLWASGRMYDKVANYEQARILMQYAQETNDAKSASQSA